MDVKCDGGKIKRNLTVNWSFHGSFEVIMKHVLSSFFVISMALWKGWYSLVFCKWLELTFAKPTIQKHKKHSIKSKSGSWNRYFYMPFPHCPRNHFVEPFSEHCIFIYLVNIYLGFVGIPTTCGQSNIHWLPWKGSCEPEHFFHVNNNGLLSGKVKMNGFEHEATECIFIATHELFVQERCGRVKKIKKSTSVNSVKG